MKKPVPYAWCLLVLLGGLSGCCWRGKRTAATFCKLRMEQTYEVVHIQRMQAYRQYLVFVAIIHAVLYLVGPGCRRGRVETAHMLEVLRAI